MEDNDTTNNIIKTSNIININIDQTKQENDENFGLLNLRNKSDSSSIIRNNNNNNNINNDINRPTNSCFTIYNTSNIASTSFNNNNNNNEIDSLNFLNAKNNQCQQNSNNYQMNDEKNNQYHFSTKLNTNRELFSTIKNQTSSSYGIKK